MKFAVSSSPVSCPEPHQLKGPGSRHVWCKNILVYDESGKLQFSENITSHALPVMFFQGVCICTFSDGDGKTVPKIYSVWGILLTKYEPRHVKTNKVTVRPSKSQISLGICPVWSESSLCAQWVAKDPSFLHADNEDSDQTGRMPRLIWIFAGRTIILLVLSCRGSYSNVTVPRNHKMYAYNIFS